MLLNVEPEHVATWASTVAAVVAILVALLALRSDRFFRTRDGLAALLARFEAADFHTLVWRMEQRTRPPNTKDSSALDRVDPQKLKAELPDTEDGRAKRALIELILAQDWTVQRAGMHEVYFFALRVDAWLVATRRGRRRRACLLNDTFGYQLLSTLLDHRTIALRLQDPGKGDDYYPVQYGCLEPGYLDLVDRLAGDLLHRGRRKQPLSADVVASLSKKRHASTTALEEIASRLASDRRAPSGASLNHAP